MTAATTTTHYAALGVPQTATREEIATAYRQAMILVHPDRGGDPAAAQRLNAAYAVLNDPAQRQAYDQELAAEAEAAQRQRATASAQMPGATQTIILETEDPYRTVDMTDIGMGHMAPDTARRFAAGASTVGIVLLWAAWYLLGIVLGVVGLAAAMILTEPGELRQWAGLANSLGILVMLAWAAAPAALLIRSRRRRGRTAPRR